MYRICNVNYRFCSHDIHVHAPLHIYGILKKKRSIHTQHMHYKLVEPKNAPYYCETPLPDLQKRKPSGITINAIFTDHIINRKLMTVSLL